MDLSRPTQRCCPCCDIPDYGLPPYVKHLVAITSIYNPPLLLEDHWQDVTVGSILGISVAYFAYRQYYPSLADKLSHRPFSPRIKDESSGPVLPVHDPSTDQRYDPTGGTRDYDSFELDRTIQRPAPQHLRDAWKDHEDPNAREGILRSDRRESGSDHDGH
jgi:hypothetical protein